MSGQSIFKSAYDKYTKISFEEKGWACYIVNRRRSYCDVLALKNNTIAIIEVKSSAELSCRKNFDDTKNLKVTLPNDFKNRRKTIMNDIKNKKSISLIKLYAVSVACQLYRYFYEFNNKRSWPSD